MLEGIDDLYEPRRLALESGYRRLADGTMLVCALHRLPRCTWRMVEWWLKDARPYQRDPELFIRWHPHDHIGIDGDVVRQRIGGREFDSRVHAVEPAEILAVDRLGAAGFAGASCGRMQPLVSPFPTGVVVHVGRDTDAGLEMRSRFWLGETDPSGRFDADTKARIFTDDQAAATLQHTLEEYAYLASFLPDLYVSASQ